MNTILVGIDFSECSLNALEHAISIARKAEADILMLWVRHHESEKILMSYKSENIKEEIQHRFEILIKKYKADFPYALNYEIRKGKIYKEIVKAADENQASLILMGTHGTSGFEEFWIGSNANRVISSTSVPVITIQSNIDVGRELKRIVLPIDSTPETRQKIIYTSILASLFKAEIHVLGLYSADSSFLKEKVDEYSKQMVEHLEEEGVAYKHLSLEADNLTTATIKYAKEVDANLIAIMTEQEKSASNILLGPYASQMVNHSPIPVLSIHPQRIESIL